MLWRRPCTLCLASRGLWTCTMACMLPLIKKKQMMRQKPRKKVMLVERDSLVQPANVETGKVLRHLGPTREHAGDTALIEKWYYVTCQKFNVKCRILNVKCQMSAWTDEVSWYDLTQQSPNQEGCPAALRGLWTKLWGARRAARPPEGCGHFYWSW